MTNRAGMTLIEVVVALTVAGTALAAGYGALAIITDHTARADDAAGVAIRDALLRQTLTEWLAATRVSGVLAGPSFEGIDGEHEDVPDDVLVFLTSAPTPLNVRETIVMLYVDRENSTPERGLTAVLLPWNVPGTAGNAPIQGAQHRNVQSATAARRIELVPNATSLDIRYRSGLLKEADWLPSWISTSVPPSAIEIRIDAHEAEPLPSLLRLPIRVPVRSIR